jgi:hypothetical protein
MPAGYDEIELTAALLSFSWLPVLAQDNVTFGLQSSLRKKLSVRTEQNFTSKLREPEGAL